MNNTTFKEMAKEFNEVLANVQVSDTAEPSYIKRRLFEHLKSSYPQLNMREVDYHGNKFEIRIDYTHDFLGMKRFDRGDIILVFSMKTKRTKQLKKISATRNKYIHTKHEKPVSFSYYTIHSYTATFDWVSEKAGDVKIRHAGSMSNDEAEKIEGENVQELIVKLKETYQEQFNVSIVQPFIKAIALRLRKYDDVQAILSDEIKTAIKEKNSPVVFDKIAEMIIEKKLIV